MYAGIIVGNAITDAAGKAPSSADTKVLPDTDGVLRLNGYKFYSTGTLFADVIAVSALDAEGRDVQAIIPADRQPVSNCSMIGTDSDSGPRPAAAPGSLMSRCSRTRSSRCPTATCWATRPLSCSCIWPSVAVGIAYAVFDDAVDYVRTKARPASHSVADSAATDPFVLEAVGEISAAATSAEAIVLTAADAIDRLVDGGQQSDPDALADVAVTVARAQLVAERLTISAAERLFDTGGASATARALNLDRHWRNARTIAGHSPLAYKAYAAGDYAVNGTWPAANGYF